MTEAPESGMTPEEAIVVRLPAHQLEQVRSAAAQRGLEIEDFVAEAIQAFAVPGTTHQAEAAGLAPHVVVAPLRRLPSPVRAAVLAAGATMGFAWTLVGRGRYRIGPGLITNGRLRLQGPGRITIGRDLNAWARTGVNVLSTFRTEATIDIGDRVRLNGAGIQAASRIEVGDDVILGSCTILDTDHHAVNPSGRRTGRVATRPIRIGNNVWIGGAVVLKGVNVGDNSVVGLGSVVTADVPPGVVVAGNPARVVRRLED